MKTSCLIIALLLATQIGLSQDNVLKGALFDAKGKEIKKHPVTLGKVSPVTLKTNKYGIFEFSNANLQDTLYIGDKKGKNPIAIPVNGHAFISIQSQKGNFDTEYLSEPNLQLLRDLQQAAKIKRRTHNMMDKEDILLSGCDDIYCLLRTMAGITIENNEVYIYGMNLSKDAGTAALIVINGIPGGNLGNIIIQDIETITVVREASRYGVRGSNGAIEINFQGY